MANDPVPVSDDAIIEHLRAELAKAEPSRARRIIEKFFLAARHDRRTRCLVNRRP